MDNNEPNDAEYYKRIIEAGSRERLSNKALLRFIQDIRDETKSNIPKSWLGLLSKAEITEKFHVYKLCSECRCIYTEKDAKNEYDCGNIILANGKRKQCQAPLGNALTMPYRPISAWIEDKLKLYGPESFKEMCNSWKQRFTEPGVLSDWFDGEKFTEETEWITDPEYDLSLGLLVNIDWWQPFQRTVHSMGGMYASVLNLPRELRQKLENIFTLAIIPGPNEPHTTQMNHVLRPLVDELKILQQGVKIAGLKVRVKVMNWACDLPALRKTLGWLSHNANKGCTKCHQQLRKDPELIYQKGTPRTDNEHREIGLKLKEMERGGQKTRMEALQTDTGIRISILNELTYHRPVSDHVIEPMHNLLIGISKRVITTIIKEKDVDLSKLADRLAGVLSSGLVQRIRVNFSWFTAHDWLEFLITGAVYGLQELIDADTLRIVQLLREAIEIYLRRTVDLKELEQADVLMRLALRRYSRYDNGFPNLHLSLHISADIKRFGPAPVYWAFSFERKNGVDGKLQTNGHATSMAYQVMKKVDVTSQSKKEGAVRETVKEFKGKRKHLNARNVELEMLRMKLPETDLTTLETVTSAVLPWKETIKKGDCIELATGEHVKVNTVILVNGEKLVVEGRQYIGRITTSDIAKSGPCYSDIDVTKFYFMPNQFKAKAKYVGAGGRHLLLPMRKKQCH